MKIILFGIVKDIVGKAEIEVSIKESISIEKLKSIILEQYPKLKDINKFAFAINEEYGFNDTIVIETDVVAIIPPVSGG